MGARSHRLGVVGHLAPPGPPVVNRCARGPACTAWELVDLDNGQKQRVGAVCDRPLCDPCENRAAQVLTDAPAVYAQLRAHTLRPQQATATEQVSTSRAHPLPLNTAALNAGEQLRDLLEQGEDTVRYVAHLTWAVRVGKREGRRVAESAQFLARHLPAWITADTDAVGALLDWRNSVRRLPGLDPAGPAAVRRHDEPCMYCEVKAITYQSGEDVVRCQSCGHTWDRDLYAVKAAAFADHLRRIEAQ